MRLKKVQVRNFIGCRDICIDVATPILIVAGDNESGKSSLYESITLAATGEMARVNLKKDYGDVVTDGARTGNIFIEFDDAQASFEVPSGKWGESKSLTAPALRYSLNAHRFSGLDETERRRFLFALSGKSPSKEEVTKRLRARGGISDALIAEVLPVLTAKGFDGASKYAADQARESKGRWRETTSEQWGAAKAPEWKADSPDFDADAHTLLSMQGASKQAALAEAKTARDQLQGRVTAAARTQQTIADMRQRLAGKPGLEIQRSKQIDEVEFAQADLQTATAALEAIEKKIAAAKKAETAPPAPKRKGGKGADIVAPPSPLQQESIQTLREFVDIANESAGIAYKGGDTTEWADCGLIPTAVELIDRFDKLWPDYAVQGQPDPGIEAGQDPAPAPSPAGTAQTERTSAAQAVLSADGRLGSARLALHQTERELAELSGSQTVLDELTARDEIETPGTAQLEAAQNSVLDLDAEAQSLDIKLRASDSARTARTDADRRTQHARSLHGTILAWDACAKALAPDGIPAEIVAEALQPINDQLAAIAQQSTWPPVTLDAAMTIRYGGRRFDLLSESGKWRADACLAAMIAIIGKSRFVMLDRIDINSLVNRAKLLRWIGTAVRSGDLDGAVLLGTLKTPPTGLPQQLFQSVWLDAGRVASAARQMA